MSRGTKNLDRMTKQELKDLVRECLLERDKLKKENGGLRSTLLQQKESLRQYTDLYDNSPVGCFTVDGGGLVRTVNRTGALMLSSDRDTLTGQPFRSFVLKEDRESFDLHLRNVLRGSGPYRCELRLQGGKHSFFQARLESTAVKDDIGNIVEIRNTVSDITDHKRTEDKLYRNQAILRAIIDATDVMLVYLDPDFNFVWVNPAYAEACGMKPEDLAGRNHFELYPHPENETIFRRVRDTGRPVFFKDKPFEFLDQPERGVTYWDWSLTPHKDQADRVIGLVFSLRETTKFKRAELELAESEARFRRIAETSADVIFQLDPEGRVTYCSPAIKFFGYSFDQVIGHFFAEFIPENELSRAMEALQQVNRGDVVRLFDIRILKADGSPVDCEISATPVILNCGVSGIQGITRNITERRKADESIRQHASLLEGIKKIFEEGLKSCSDEELAGKFLQYVERITGSRFGFVGEIGQDGRLQNMVGINPDWQQHVTTDQTEHRNSSGNLRLAGLYGKVVLEGKTLLTNDPVSHPMGIGAPPGHPPLTSFLGVPLVYGGRTIGLIALGNRPGGYRREELMLLEGLAPAFVETLFKCRLETALRRSEAQLRTIFDNMTEGLVVADLAGNLVQWNPAAVAVHGFSSEEEYLRDLPYFRNKFELSTDMDGILPFEQWPMMRILQGETLHDWEVNVRRLDIDWQRTLSYSGTLARSSEDKPLLGVLALSDITERKWVEQQLVRAKMEWEMTFDSVPDLIAILDGQHRIIRANLAMAERMRLSPGQCVSRKCFTCMHDEKNPPQNCPHTLTMIDGMEHRAEVYEEKLGGYFLVTTTPLKDEDGQIIATVHVARDITDLKQAEELLLESEKRFKTAEKMAHLGSWELDLVNNVLQWSDEVYQIFGIQPQPFHLCYEDFLAAVHPDDREAVEKSYRHCLETGNDTYEVEHRIIRHCTGEIRHVLQKCEQQRDYTGRIISSVGMVHDITERKLAEERIRLLNLELLDSVRMLEKSNMELERSNWDLEQFVNIASHDLQEPLRTISSFVQLLRRRYEGKLDDKADTFMNFVVEGTMQMQRLINDLLAFSRAGGGQLAIRPIVFHSIFDKLLLNLKVAIEENQAEIILDDLPVFHGDEAQIILLFQNLIANAIKFRRTEAPRIQVFAEQLENEIKICVRDNGIGIDPQHADRVFLIFQRLHRREEYSGTGIGLAICKKIVERHGGRIWVESTPGQGSTFCFTLPKNQESKL